MLSGIALGHNPRKIAEAMEKTMGSGYKNCEQLARTETLHFMNQATKDAYKEHGVKKYEYICGLDERTCPICGGLDGKVFELKYAEEGVNYPVMHPNCRCSTVMYIEKDDMDRLFEKSEGGFDVDEKMSYEEWLHRQDSFRQLRILGKSNYNDFLNGMTLKDILEKNQTVKKEFPNEKWIPISASSSTSVFISETRQKDGKKDPSVYESDKMMALALAEKSGKNVFMIPERNEGKNPDCIFCGEFLEMKHVRGGHRKVGKNAMNALTQAENVFLYVDKPTSIEECLSSIKGYYSNNKKQAIKENKEFKEPNKNGLLYIFTNGKLYKSVWGRCKLKKPRELNKLPIVHSARVPSHLAITIISHFHIMSRLKKQDVLCLE